MSQPKGLALWHQFVKSRDTSQIGNLISDHATLHSPVVWTPQRGKNIVGMYLIAACDIIANEHFRYVREVSNDEHAMLEFSSIIDGISVEGVDMLTFDSDGKLLDIKVMIRPLKAVNIVHQKMGEFLMKMKSG